MKSGAKRRTFRIAKRSGIDSLTKPARASQGPIFVNVPVLVGRKKRAATLVGTPGVCALRHCSHGANARRIPCDFLFADDSSIHINAGLPSGQYTIHLTQQAMMERARIG